VVEERTITRILCPEELRLPVPPPVAVPDGAIVRGNREGLGFLGQRFSREALLADRLADAAGQCPEPTDAAPEVRR
jgi:hypothetical protein